MEKGVFQPVSFTRARPSWQLDPSLLLYVPFWNLDGGTFLSQDAYGHTLVNSGGTPNGQGGWTFDGTNDRLTTETVTEAFTELTVAAWIKPTKATVGVVVGRAYDFIFTDNALGDLYWYGNGSSGSFNVALTSISSVSDGLWHWLAATFQYDGVSGYIAGFLDTVQVLSRTSTAAVNIRSGTTVQIGNGGGGYYGGDIGEIFLWKRLLEVDEIQGMRWNTLGRYQ